jgi:pimeloyl-ACP methyl ester carboxylesterase
MLTRLVPLVVLLLASVLPIGAGSAETATQEGTPAGSPIRGRSEVGDQRLAIDCLGSGGPTIVFEAGQGQGGASMVALQQELARDHMACTYDRARGPGPAGAVPTAADVVADLHALLAAAAVPGPYVLVGQSVGAVFVQLYARTYPDDVAGVVAINPVPPAEPWLDRALPLMTEPERADEEAYYRGEVDDGFDFYTSFAQLDAAPPPPDVPFELLLSTVAQCERPDDVCSRTYPVYEAVMREVVDEWPQGHLTQVTAGHEPWVDAFDETIAVIRRVLPATDGPELDPMASHHPWQMDKHWGQRLPSCDRAPSCGWRGRHR